MTDIYAQHRAAFAQVEAFEPVVVLKNGERVATIAFKFPRDGAGRLYAYVHWLGLEMVRGYAGGGGYDKRSAACADAARKLDMRNSATKRIAFRDALAKDDGYGWQQNLEADGFTVLQAV